jgi:hypothetical protein
VLPDPHEDSRARASTSECSRVSSRTGSEVGVDEGGRSPMRARARCACRSSRIRPAASTPADCRNRGRGGQPVSRMTTPDRRGHGDAQLWRFARPATSFQSRPHSSSRGHRGQDSAGCLCPIPAVSPPAAALLLCCLQDPIAWLAPDASRSPWRARGRLARFPRGGGARRAATRCLRREEGVSTLLACGGARDAAREALRGDRRRSCQGLADAPKRPSWDGGRGPPVN